jgi:putative membrane protein
MNSQSDPGSVTGETLLEARFDRGIIPYTRWVVSGILLITVVGILLIPFWLLLSRWYGSEYMRRLSARLTTRALEIRKGVFFRSESTIPLNRITDVRLHDGPVMRYFGLRGLRLETAGQAGQTAGSEGDLVGVVDAVEFRDRILRQRQKVLDEEQGADSPAPAVGDAADVLIEIRDILKRIESKS